MSAIVEQARTRLEEVRGTLRAGSLLGSKGLLGSNGQLFGGTILAKPGTRRLPQPLWEKLPPQVQTRIQDIQKLRREGLARVGILARVTTREEAPASPAVPPPAPTLYPAAPEAPVKVDLMMKPRLY